MSSIFDIVKEDLMDYTFLISMIILLAIPLFNIILYKDKEDYGGYDERQEIVRGKAFKYGFLTMVSVEGIMLLKEQTDGISIECNVLMMAGILIGVLVVVLYCIWNDAYWQLKQKPMPFVCMLGAVALSNMFIAKGKTIVENGIVTWEGSNPVFMAVFFSIILINVIIKMYIDKKKDQ